MKKKNFLICAMSIVMLLPYVYPVVDVNRERDFLMQQWDKNSLIYITNTVSNQSVSVNNIGILYDGILTHSWTSVDRLGYEGSNLVMYLKNGNRVEISEKDLNLSAYDTFMLLIKTVRSSHLRKDVNVLYKLGHNYAWSLLQHLLGEKQATLVAQGQSDITSEQEKILEKWFEDITKYKKPPEYIIGSVDFLGLTIYVEQPVYIPREETEMMCLSVIDHLKKRKKQDLVILDLGTGVGCMALVLAQAFPESTVYASEISKQALELAKKNARVNGIENIVFVESDLYKNLPKNTFDFIISNPPRIDDAQYERKYGTALFKGEGWEERAAIVSSDGGEGLLNQVILMARDYLKTEGKSELFVEVCPEQINVIQQKFKQVGFASNTILRGAINGCWGIVGELKS